MLGWQYLSKQLEEIVHSAVRFAKARKHEEATIGLSAVLFWIAYSFPSWLNPELKDWVGSWHGLLIIPGIFYAAGLSSLSYGTYRIWLLINTPDLPPPKDRPSAIKGPIAFTPADGNLFRRLGREERLRKLLGFIEDDQVRLVIVTGESGVGKTSLLRAGLTDILKNKSIDYHYWEAVPSSPGQGLLRAIQESWHSGPATGVEDAISSASSARPQSLDDLVNPSAELGNQRHVIVLDQLEQLPVGSGNGAIFRLLRKVAREAKPPHRVTWIVAFRRDFRSEWEDFTIAEKERGIYPAEISLRPFTVEQAHDVVSQLIVEAQLSVHQKVMQNLIDAATVSGEVSPVDIGIGLLVLAELHDGRGGQTVTVEDYQFAGGAEGVLTHYAGGCLEIFSKPDREIVLKAMLALRDPSTNQRIAEGRTHIELAKEIQADARRLKIQLDRLTQKDARLLELILPAGGEEMRYRLPHERLIPALHRMAGQLLADVDQTKLRLENAFTAWKNNDRNRHYLLKGRDLRLVERFETQMPEGKDKSDKRTFLRRSRRWRMLGRFALAATLIILLSVGWLAYSKYQRYDARRYLTDNNYPPEMYDWQHQLKILVLNDPTNMQRLPWLNSNRLEEVTINMPDTTNSLKGLVDGLANCPALDTLTIDSPFTEVKDLTPLTQLTQIRHLTLSSTGKRYSSDSSAVTIAKHYDVTPLTNLPALTHLTLDLNATQITELTPLERLSSLTQLTLNFKHGYVAELTPLAKLPALTQLEVDLDFHLEGTDLTPLTHLPSLKVLKISGGWHFYDPTPFARKPPDLTPLAHLPDVTQLSLDFRNSEMKDLTPLTNLPTLTSLSIAVCGFGNPDLTPLTTLPRLTKLMVDLTHCHTDLTPLTKLPALTQLTLYLDVDDNRNLTFLEKLPSFKQLEFSLRNVSELTPLTKLPAPIQLNLDLSYSSGTDLTPLTKVPTLTQLSLDLSHSEVSDLTPLTKLSTLTQLSLNLSNSKVSDLTPLTKLPALTELSLYLTGSNVSDLTPLMKLNSCQTLILRVNTSQRMSLKGIPPSVTHLEF